MYRNMLLAVWLLCGVAQGGLQAQTTEETMKKETVFRQMFPQGEPNPPANAQFFTGQSYLAPLTHNEALHCPIYNVTFEPGCRNNWHSHTGGQILIVTAGRGYYQEQGQPARPLAAGDVVEIAPNVVHWHGAAPDSWFSHLAVECNPQTNRNTWLDPVTDEQYAEATAVAAPALSADAARHAAEWGSDEVAALAATDPELATVFGNFAFDDVRRHSDLDLRTRLLVTMASAVAMQTEGMFHATVKAALANGVEPVVLREVVYHTVPYVGMARAAEALAMLNGQLAAAGVSLPLEPQSVTTPDDRFEKGLALQKSIFGEQIDRMYASAPENQIHMQRFLSANCFGDYQTRPALDVPTRELLTFAILVSLGGCEAQVKGHIAGNVAVGNDKATLLAVATQLLPYIGYPRTLNAIACLNEVVPEAAK